MAASFHLQRRVTLSRSPSYPIPFVSALPCDHIVHVLASSSPNRVFPALDVLDGVWLRVGEAWLKGLRMMTFGLHKRIVGTVAGSGESQTQPYTFNEHRVKGEHSGAVDPEPVVINWH